MSITNGYATLAEYKSFITMRGSTMSTDAADDAVIENLIEQASRYIDRETGTRFFVDTVDKTRYYTPKEQYTIKIDPLSASATTVAVDYYGAQSYTTLTENTDFYLTPYNAALEGQPFTGMEIASLLSSAYFPVGVPRGLKIVGKFGYPSIPDDIRGATLNIVQSVNNIRSGQSANGRITVTQAGIVIRPEEVPPIAQMTIANYRYIT